MADTLIFNVLTKGELHSLPGWQMCTSFASPKVCRFVHPAKKKVTLSLFSPSLVIVGMGEWLGSLWISLPCHIFFIYEEGFIYI